MFIAVLSRVKIMMGKVKWVEDLLPYPPEKGQANSKAVRLPKGTPA
jgi:hypothetical protein